MAGRRSPVTDVRELVRRLETGEPDRRIARDLGVSRNTVARYRVTNTGGLPLLKIGSSRSMASTTRSGSAVTRISAERSR
jgi:FixJ family two-component response regulator